jgi:hypothetical protein
MLVSVFLFGHYLSAGQWVSVLMVFAAMGGEAYMARREKLNTDKLMKKLADESQDDNDNIGITDEPEEDKKRR